MLGNFHYFLLSADFFQFFFKKFLSGIPSVSNSLDPDQARHFVGPGLGPNCFQTLNFACWVILHTFLSSADFFSK